MAISNRHDPGPQTKRDQLNSVAHLTEGLAQNAGHAKLHGIGLIGAAQRGDKKSAQFHGEHFRDHIEETLHHTERLVEHFATHPKVRDEFRNLQRANPSERAMQQADGSDDGKGHGRRSAAPRLGEGGRFKALKSELARKGADNPAGLAADIGRKKLTKPRFQKLAAAGRK